MRSRDFAYWLQGLFELSGDSLKSLDERQTTLIKQHLQLVFKHEIDPGMGSAQHQKDLQDLHWQELQTYCKPFGIDDIKVNC